MNQLLPIQYLDLRKKIRDGDVLLFRSTSWWTRMIAVAGRSEYVHAAMAGWWRDRLMCVEMRAGGGRATLLSNLVARRPGKIDVYRVKQVLGLRSWVLDAKSQYMEAGVQDPKPKTQDPRPSFSRAAALRAMIEITGRRYGWFNLLMAAALHLPLVRWLVRPDADDLAESRLPPFCSQAVSMALRRGGIDPVPNLADRITEPGDLARSAACVYLGTLM
jgi:hypothetical protein